MLVGVMSDSHDHLVNIRKAVQVFLDRKVDAVLHAGDFCSPFVFREMEELKNRGVRMKAVFGNNDGDRVLLTQKGAGFCEFKDGVHLCELDGRKILLIHYPDIAESLYRSGDFDLVVYGHNHQLASQGEERKLLNPGTCSGYLAERATVALLDTATLKHEIISF